MTPVFVQAVGPTSVASLLSRVWISWADKRFAERIKDIVHDAVFLALDSELGIDSGKLAAVASAAVHRQMYTDYGNHRDSCVLNHPEWGHDCHCDLYEDEDLANCELEQSEPHG